MAATRNLYHIDDLLIRAGAGLGCLVALGLIAWSQLSPEQTRQVLDALGLGVLGLLGVALAPLSLLLVGHAVRRKEKRVLLLHGILARQLELRVPDFLANTDFTRDDLEETFEALNRSGLGYYEWDREADWIQDARLRTGELHFDRCESCQASLSISVRVGSPGVPECPYCDARLDRGELARAKRRLAEEIREVERPRHSALASSRGDEEATFSIGLFLLMLAVFWPLGVGYAVRYAYKYG